MRILVTSVPAGEAPEAIREQWVGLRLPLHPDTPGLSRAQTVGVVSGRPSLWRRLLGLKTSGARSGYLVPFASAIDALSAKSPEAADWWRTNAVFAVDDQACLFFHASCCVLESAEASPEDTSELGGGPFIVDRE